MENLQILKHIPWITEPVDVKKFTQQYNEELDNAGGGRPYNQAFNYKERMQDFFNFDLNNQVLSPDADPNQPNKDTENDNVDFAKLEDACSVDLLTMPGELPARELCVNGPVKESGRVTNWYAGAYMDGVIPKEAAEKLSCLSAQAEELYKRETVKDYIRLRHRLLKYSTTVRMVMKTDNQPEEVVNFDSNGEGSCLREVLFNVRIHRPFHKKTFSLKGHNRFPRHSQELLILGSQRLNELRDSLICMNDYYIHKDMSWDPDTRKIPNLDLLSQDHDQPYKITIGAGELEHSEKLFPSSFFYINGNCYPDTRNPGGEDIVENIINWSKKYEKIGKINCVKMENAKLSDLKLRLGYPYVFLHLGNCEHLIVFTDVRLVSRTDIQDPSRYPLSRGNPCKINVKCFACSLLLARWMVVDEPRIQIPYTHFCDKCLKEYFYNERGEKLTDFKLYPFVDEFAAQNLKENKKKEKPKTIQFKFPNDDVESKLVITPLDENDVEEDYDEVDGSGYESDMEI